MAIRTTYECDRCGKTSTSQDVYWVVGIFAKYLTSNPTGVEELQHVKDRSIIMCGQCMDQSEIYIKTAPPYAPQPKNTKSTLDCIRELIKDILKIRGRGDEKT